MGGIGRGGARVPNVNQAFVVTEAAINESIDLARFKPPAPTVGTVVTEPGKSPYKYGWSPPQPEAAGRPNSGSRSGQLFAAPPGATWQWWSLGLGAVSVVFLAAGLWFSRRK